VEDTWPAKVQVMQLLEVLVVRPPSRHNGGVRKDAGRNIDTNIETDDGVVCAKGCKARNNHTMITVQHVMCGLSSSSLKWCECVPRVGICSIVQRR